MKMLNLSNYQITTRRLINVFAIFLYLGICATQSTDGTNCTFSSADRCYIDYDDNYVFNRTLCSVLDASVLPLPSTLNNSLELSTLLDERVSSFPIWLDCQRHVGYWSCGNFNYYCAGCLNNTGYWNWKNDPKEDEYCIRYRSDNFIEATSCTKEENLLCVRDTPPLATSTVAYSTAVDMTSSTPTTTNTELPTTLAPPDATNAHLTAGTEAVADPVTDPNYGRRSNRNGQVYNRVPNSCPQQTIIREILNTATTTCALRCFSSMSCSSFNVCGENNEGKTTTCQLLEDNGDTENGHHSSVTCSCLHYEWLV
ncbi:uncharacterized protein [Apostichopus japonicus]|uniref:uncharacterized protein n=1 Tax=Stichopus japonicus TaxID=307972 RepID=UPI003AB7E1E9